MTEDKPHIVFEKDRVLGAAHMFPSYRDAHAYWQTVHHTINRPFVIATLGRVIDPSTPVIDPSE
jgi:hypothetical protein